MILIQKQKFFSWFDSYDIFNENNSIVFRVKGKLSWGHKLEIYDAENRHLGTVVEKVLTWLPKYRFFINNEEVGCLRRKFTFFRPKFELDCNGWIIEGNIFEWNYSVMTHNEPVMTCNKRLFRLTDTYCMDIKDPRDALLCLMIALSIDIGKCRR